MSTTRKVPKKKATEETLRPHFLCGVGLGTEEVQCQPITNSETQRSIQLESQACRHTRSDLT
jgi:hypothetical protein